MTTTVVPGPTEADSDVAGKLIAIAEELGHGPRVVQITHEPGLVFLVPDDVAEKYNADRQETEKAQPKRGRRVTADDTSGDGAK